MPTTDVSPFLKFITELGGWGALVVFFGACLTLAWKGGKAFMDLAREFSTNVVSKLEAIRLEMSNHNARLEELDERIEVVDNRILDHTQKLERLTERLTHICGHNNKAS
jgi:hypothetical protein